LKTFENVSEAVKVGEAGARDNVSETKDQRDRNRGSIIAGETAGLFRRSRRERDRVMNMHRATGETRELQPDTDLGLSASGRYGRDKRTRPR
jgi:hypothetical protein